MQRFVKKNPNNPLSPKGRWRDEGKYAISTLSGYLKYHLYSVLEMVIGSTAVKVPFDSRR
jgi:hypothetical protein